MNDFTRGLFVSVILSGPREETRSREHPEVKFTGHVDTTSKNTTKNFSNNSDMKTPQDFYDSASPYVRHDVLLVILEMTPTLNFLKTGMFIMSK